MDDSILKIYKYGDDVLKLRATELTDIGGKIVELAKRMIATMYEAPGIGLAAPQVGESIRLFTMDVSSGEDPAEAMVWINPVILEQDGGELREEGCLSVPGYTFPIRRSDHILLRALDLDGKEVQMEFEGLKARVVQHEIDHLDGTLIVDRLSPLKRTLVRQEIAKLRKNGEW